MATQAVTLHASAAEVASGTGPTLDCGAAAQISTLRLALTISASSELGNGQGGGAFRPTFALVLEHSGDGVAWRQHSFLTGSPNLRTERFVVSALDRYVRAKWTIDGITPSVTFSLAGDGA